MEKTVTNYVILEDFYISNLIKQTNAHIYNGWQPYGNPFCNRAVLDDDNAYFHQAMVKYAKTTRIEDLQFRHDILKTMYSIIADLPDDDQAVDDAIDEFIESAESHS